MRVCVYGIMRDEENHVHEWAETTADADSVFVLDTGSTDATVEALETFDIGVAEAVFLPFRFDDARNCALALAPPADLYLRLDADERLRPGWRKVIDDAYDPQVQRYQYRVENVAGGTWGRHTRDDLHRRGGFRWRYPTHEVLVGPTVPVRAVPRLVVDHVSTQRREHHDTNLAVLREAVAEYPGDHRMAFYLGRELWYADDWSGCREALERFLALPGGWGAERCEAYRILGHIDDFPERWYWRAVGEAPERREPWVDLMRLYADANRWQAAAAVTELAVSRNEPWLYPTTPSAWGEEFNALARRIIDAVNARAG